MHMTALKRRENDKQPTLYIDFINMYVYLCVIRTWQNIPIAVFLHIPIDSSGYSGQAIVFFY